MKVGRILLFAAIVYVAISATVYRFAHPGLTETQLFLRLFDAVLWR